MPKIAVYESVVQLSRTTLKVPTFRSGSAGRPHTLLGYLIAPEGAELHQPTTGPPMLKIPKPGRTGEAWLVCPADALVAAAEGRDGLAFEPYTGGSHATA